MRKWMIAVSLLLASIAAQAAPHGVKVGVLTCSIDGGWGYVLGSSKDLHCRYRPEHGSEDRYVGRIDKFGVDLGYTSGATMVWNVVAPASDMRAGALEGHYAGATASATVAIGIGANVLLGGFDKSIALQPVSVEGNSGLAVSAGIGALHLRKVPDAAPLAANASREYYALWFEFDQDRMTPSGKVVVAEAVRNAKADGVRKVVIVGHADRAGSDSYNMDLSLRRAEAVRQEMVRDGMAENAIIVDGRGDRDPAVATEVGVREPENRRVVISWQRWRQASY